MPLIRSAFRDHADLAAGASSELSGRHAGLHGEFLNRIRNPEIIEVSVDLRIHITDAVPQIKIGLGPRARHVEAENLRARRRRNNAWSDQRKIQRVTPVQRHATYIPAIDYAAHRALVVFEQRGDRLHLHRIRHAAHFKNHFGARNLIHLHQHAGHICFLKAFRLNNQRIGCRIELQELKLSVRV